MKTISKYLSLLIILVTLLSACNQNAAVTPTAEPTATVPLPTPNVNIDSGPNVEEDRVHGAVESGRLPGDV